MFEGLKELASVIIEEKEKYKRKWGNFPNSYFFVNREFSKERKPGPKPDMDKRMKRVEALAKKLKCDEIVREVVKSLIENWFLGYKLEYQLEWDTDKDIRIPHWFIKKERSLRPDLYLINFYLETEYKKGRPVNPKLLIGIYFDDYGNGIYEEDYVPNITVNEIHLLIVRIFELVFGEFARKKKIELTL